MIHIIDRQTERILDVLVNQSDRKIYWDTKMTEGLEDNVLIFEFRMLADSPAAKHIIPKNKLTAQDQDGFHRLFIIDSVETTHNENGKILKVSALGDHIELASEEPIPPQTLPGQTAETAVQFVLANTRYQPGQIDFAGSRTITFDTYTDPLGALQKIASEFELEIRFRVNVNPDGSITRIVDLLKPDEVFDGKEIVFGKDMTGIRRKENTENICTRLVGIGPADEDGNLVTFASVNGGKIYVEDEEAYQRWNNAGRHIWGIFEYQPEGDTEVTPESLLEATKKEMEKRKNSAVEWEVSAAALEQVIGLEHERVRVGMNVRIKDEAFDPPIYLEARVLETKMPELDDPNGNFSYTFGNYRQVTVVVPPEVKAIQKTLFRNANAWTAAKSIATQALADAAKAQETADGKITSFYQPDPPATASEGDLWFDTDDGNKPYIWQNGQWVNAQDSGIAEALNRASDAQATADKKVQTFFSETQPTPEGVGDLWYNPASGALFRWSGSAWELVSDVTGRNTAADTAKVGGKPAGQVIDDITNAQQTANEAKQMAGNAVQQEKLYNGVSISSADGFKVTRSDQLVQGVFNATEGIRFQTRPDTASVWQDAFFFDVNTKKFKFAGHLEGASGTFAGDLTASRVVIGPPTPEVGWWEDGATGITLKMPIRISDGVFEWGNPLDIKLLNGAVWFETVDSIVLSPTQEVISEAPTSIIGTLTVTGVVDFDSWLDVAADVNFSNQNGRIFTDTSAQVGYIQTTGNEWRATKYKSTTYVPVRASSFPTGSLAEYKEDIHPWQESALEKIRNTTIYEYYLKSELEQGIQRKRQGLVIGEGYNTPDGVVDGDGVEQYLLNAWSWKAIQELDSVQMNHEDRIATLEAKIAELEAKIS